MAPSVPDMASNVDDLITQLDTHGYLADRGLATSLFLALSLQRPLFLEGEAGVGKTELAKVIAALRGSELIRLQCYEGIDSAQALYEWDYTRQLLHLRTAEATGAASAAASETLEAELFDEKFLIRRPLLQAIDHRREISPVLLIDEVDRADDEFEAFLLEALSDYSVTIPELGSITAVTPPVVIITSNRTRDVHDALKRRALYHWVEHPDFEREIAIIGRKAASVPASLARQVASAAGQFREMGLYKPPGIAESLDWATSLHLLGETKMTVESVDASLGAILKYREDQERARRSGLESVIDIALSA